MRHAGNSQCELRELELLRGSLDAQIMRCHTSPAQPQTTSTSDYLLDDTEDLDFPGQSPKIACAHGNRAVVSSESNSLIKSQAEL